MLEMDPLNLHLGLCPELKIERNGSVGDHIDNG